MITKLQDKSRIIFTHNGSSVFIILVLQDFLKTSKWCKHIQLQIDLISESFFQNHYGLSIPNHKSTMFLCEKALDTIMPATTVILLQFYYIETLLHAVLFSV
jgi:hypothetical protein